VALEPLDRRISSFLTSENHEKFPDFTFLPQAVYVAGRIGVESEDSIQSIYLYGENQ